MFPLVHCTIGELFDETAVTEYNMTCTDLLFHSDFLGKGDFVVVFWLSGPDNIWHLISGYLVFSEEIVLCSNCTSTIAPHIYSANNQMHTFL